MPGRSIRGPGLVLNPPDLVVPLRVPPVLQRPLQVLLQPLQGPAQVLLGPARLPLRPLTVLQLQLSLEESRLQSQDLAVTAEAVRARHLEVTRGSRTKDQKESWDLYWLWYGSVSSCTVGTRRRGAGLGGGGTCWYLVPGLALPDLGLERVQPVLGLLQLADTLTGIALVLTELPLLLVNQPLRDGTRETANTLDGGDESETEYTEGSDLGRSGWSACRAAVESTNNSACSSCWGHVVTISGTGRWEYSSQSAAPPQGDLGRTGGASGRPWSSLALPRTGSLLPLWGFTGRYSQPRRRLSIISHPEKEPSLGGLSQGVSLLAGASSGPLPSLSLWLAGRQLTSTAVSRDSMDDAGLGLVPSHMGLSVSNSEEEDSKVTMVASDSWEVLAGSSTPGVAVE
ncbi:hypothetical protein EYF80_015066 [Liparis tanakae]|uniref:Uncharacterized protein n=1 Tax=Liparis tanakae TaxID=230148 RepID=A0A4Z2I9V2_9TELE|nr:hypothetical protein EYF80_015066 [Liparis tanakae]